MHSRSQYRARPTLHSVHSAIARPHRGFRQLTRCKVITVRADANARHPRGLVRPKTGRTATSRSSGAIEGRSLELRALAMCVGSEPSRCLGSQRACTALSAAPDHPRQGGPTGPRTGSSAEARPVSMPPSAEPSWGEGSIDTQGRAKATPGSCAQALARTRFHAVAACCESLPVRRRALLGRGQH
jgi:hypothetical protein